MEKDILYDIEAKKKLVQGVIKLTEVVRVTMGPKGRHVVLDQNVNHPHFTRDGMTVAKTIELPDPMENAGAQVLKEAALKTAREVGDGTSTATVLARSLFCRSLKYITAGADEDEVRKAIQVGVKKVIDALHTMSLPVKSPDHIWQAAFVSSNGDPGMATLVTRAIERVGKDGIITVGEAAGTESTLTLTEGARLQSGYLSRHFVTDETDLKVVLDDPLILVTDKKITTLAEILPLMESIVDKNKSLVIIADSVESEALSSLVLNQNRKIFKCVAIKAPGVGAQKLQRLLDVAMLTGAALVSDAEGHRLNKVSIKQLGTARKVVVDRDTTTFIEGKGNKDALAKHVEELRAQLRQHPTQAEMTSLNERIAFVTGLAAQIHLAAHSEAEMHEMRERLEDSIEATRAAMEEGVVIGGGVALIRCMNILDSVVTENEDQLAGLKILKTTLQEPLLAIALNAGTDAAVVVGKVRNASGNIGYNAANGKYEDLIQAGIVDPVKVIRLALENASSVAGLLLSTYCIVADHREPVNQKSSEVEHLYN